MTDLECDRLAWDCENTELGAPRTCGSAPFHLANRPADERIPTSELVKMMNSIKVLGWRSEL